MTEVDFYVLDAGNSGERERFACRLADKVFRLGHRIYIHTTDADSAAALDELLWTFRPSSFVPHSLAAGKGAGDEPVTIGWGEAPGNDYDVLINLDLRAPDFAERFDRIAEVVTPDPAVRDPLRDSWRHYQERGYTVRRREV